MSSRRRKLGTQRMAILHSLGTYPERYRRGDARMLMEAFAEEVDRAGVLAYLGATEMGRSIFERFEFEAKRVTKFDLSRYGGEGRDANTIMLRGAKVKKETNVYASLLAYKKTAGCTCVLLC